jgi:hypothetical protein
MRTLNIGVFRLQAGVASIHYARIVPEPYRDFEQADPVTSKQTCERVPHRVGRDPSQSLLFGVLFEVAGEIVAITIGSVFDFGMEHKRFAQFVTSQEVLKLGGERDGALLAVFEIHSRRFPQMEQTRVQIEPERASLDNLVFPQTGVEAAVLNEFQIIALCGSDELVALLFCAEISEPFAHVFSQIQSIARVAASDSGGMDAPVEKRAQNHGVRVSRGSRVLVCFGVVERLCERGRDVCGGYDADIPAKCPQDESATVRAGGREFVFAPLVGKKSFNFGFERGSRVEDRGRAHFDGSGNRFGVVVGFETDEMPLPGSLEIQPINRPAQIDSTSCRVGRHAECNVRTVTFVKSGLPQYAAISPELEKAGDETRTRDVLLGKKAFRGGNCHTLNVTLPLPNPSGGRA